MWHLLSPQMMLEKPMPAHISYQEHRRTCTIRAHDTSSTEPYVSGLRARVHPSRSGVQAQQEKGDAATASVPDSPTQDRHYAPRCSIKGKHPPPRGPGRGGEVTGELSMARSQHVQPRSILMGQKRAPPRGQWGVPCSLWASHAQPHGKERGPGATGAAEQCGCPQALSPAAAKAKSAKTGCLRASLGRTQPYKIPFNTEAEQHD